MIRNTLVKIYEGVSLTMNDENTFYFETVEAQNAYFNSKLKYTMQNGIYQRNNRTYIRVPYTIKQMYKANYCSYINTDYENKTIYCFIVDVVYVNDNVTELEIVEDIHQTWLFNYSLTPCFIERMHTFTDVAGDNLVAESFDLGEYKNNSWVNGLGSVDDTMCIVAECSFNAFDWSATGDTWGVKSAPSLTNRNGLFSATELVAFPIRVNEGSGYRYAGTGCAFAKFMGHVNRGDSGVTVNDILSMWVYPFSFLQNLDSKVLSLDVQSPFDKIYKIGQVLQGVPINVPNRPLALDGYTPKNKKLLTYPYTQLMATNNNGGITTYKYEYFANPNQPQVTVFGTTTSEAKVRITPKAYKGMDDDFTEALDSAPFPIISYVGDAYNIWYSQNRNTIENAWNALELQSTIGIAASAIGASSNIAQSSGGVTGSFYDSSSGKTTVTMGNNISSGSLVGGAFNTVGNMASSALNTVMQAKSMLSKQQDAKLAPNTAKGVQSQGIAYQNDKTFTFICKTIDAQHAKRIDDFFTMYGYPINEIKSPSKHNRRGYTYVKTVDCHVVSSSMPESKRVSIENAFNSGVRFWADTANIGNYTIDNSTL